jgi:hypothetical protein
MTILIALMGISAFILYRFDSTLKEGYDYARRAAIPLRSKVLLIRACANEHEFFSVSLKIFSNAA